MAPKKRGIYQNKRTPGPKNPHDPRLEDKVADFSYSNDELAHLITEIWENKHPLLLAPNTYANRSAEAKAVLANRGVRLTMPIVITEAEYDEGFSLEDAGLVTKDAGGTVVLHTGIVLVVPDDRRATGSTVAGGPSLLETAKMLMAVTPNGI